MDTFISLEPITWLSYLQYMQFLPERSQSQLLNSLTLNKNHLR